MWPYILLIFTPIIIQHIGLSNKELVIQKANDRKNLNAITFFWIFLFVLLIFRHETIGRDLQRYSYTYDFIARNSWQEALYRSAEVGFNFVNKLIALSFDDFRWVLVVTAILGVYHIAKGYSKYSKDASLTIALFINMSNFVMLFSGLKQSIAISLGFLAFEFVRKKKIIAFIITVFIAMLFHSSAFMLFFMYPLYYLKITKATLIFIIPSLAVAFAFNSQIFGALAEILMRFTDYDTAITNTGAYTMLIVFAVLAIFSYVIPDENQIDDDTVAMRNFLLFSVFLQMFAPLHTLAMRMNYYYMAFIPLVIPRVIEHRSEKWDNVAVVAGYLMTFLFIVYFFVAAPADNVLDTFPYHFFWENV